MIVVNDVRMLAGYSGHDHLMTGSECVDLIGREFDSVRRLKKAVERERERLHSELHLSPVLVSVRLANGVERDIRC